jgi:hypothetical protein
LDGRDSSDRPGIELRVRRLGSNDRYDMSDVAGFELGDDGTAIVGQVGHRLSWASPAEPTAHELASTLPRGGRYSLKVARGVVAFEQLPDRGNEPARIGTIGLHDAAPRLLARPVAWGEALELAFDGDRVAYADFGCTHVDYVTQRINEERTATHRPCPLRLARSLVANHDGIVTVTFKCFGPDYGCGSRKRTIETAAGHRRILGRQIGEQPKVRLTREARSLLRRHKRLRVRVTGLDYNTIGGPRRRSTIVTLRSR